MTANRPYRRGMSHEEAIDTLHRFSGKQFDPLVVEVFAALVSCSHERMLVTA